MDKANKGDFCLAGLVAPQYPVNVLIRLQSLCITWGVGVGGRGFFGGYKNFQDEIGRIGNFQLIYRGDVKFPLTLINSVLSFA